jgi:signal transduction histidine kinase/ligand-binding sensor domain-containing protein
MNIPRTFFSRMLLALLSAIGLGAGGYLPALASDPSGVRPLNQYVHDIWTEKDGLPQNGVYGLTQTRDGYIWFGSQEGLVRFDGVNFTVFDRTNTKEIANAWVGALFEDSEGTLWFGYQGRGSGIGRYMHGTFNGLDAKRGLRHTNVRNFYEARDSAKWFSHGPWGVTREKHGVFTKFGRAEGLPTDSVYSITDDSHGNTWLLTPGGLVRYDGKSFSRVTLPDVIRHARTLIINARLCIFEDSRRDVWFSTDSGLVRLSNGTMNVYTVKNGLLENRVGEISEDSAGTLCLVSLKGITRLEHDVMTTYPAPYSFEGVNALFRDSQNSLWIASQRGLWRFADGRYDHFGRESGLNDEVVNTVTVDAEGSIWFGTDAGGLHRLREGKFVTYAEDAGLKDVVLTAVMEDSKGNLWLGSQTGGVARISNGVTTIFDERKGFPRRVDLMCEAPDGSIWFGSRDGLYLFRNGTLSRVKLTGVEDFTDPRAIFYRKNGDLVVAGASHLYTLTGNRLSRLSSNGTGGGYISSVTEDAAGRLWVGTFGGGLFRCDTDSLIQVTADEGFLSPGVFGIYADREGGTWFGTPNYGLYLYKNGKFTQFTPESGLFDYNSANIIEDDRGSMWFSANKGVYRIRKQALEDFAAGKTTSYTFDAYGTADGMKSRETNFLGHPNIFKMHDGRIVFPTVEGAAVVNPASIKLNAVPPRVVLERFTADNIPRDVRSEITLPPGTGNLEIEYVGLSFIGSNRVKYKYRLEGFDPDWVNPGNRTVAYYTNLRPGDYTFRVLAANADGIWDSTGASVSFTIRPHFYESRWFYALALLGFVFGGPSVYLLRVRQLKRREAELEHQVALRTKELRGALDNLKETQNQLVLSEKMASLGQLTAGIAHEIKNPLNFITNFAVLSADLAKDLLHELAAERDRVDPKRAAEIETLLGDLEGNVNKINEHGKRADSIVRGMLLHSRGKAGERQETDLNALLAEYTNLAYHGMRAQDTSFNIKIETNLDPAVGKLNVVPQDLSRAFLNIVNNACYAANDRKKSAGAEFNPVVRVSTKNLGEKVEIRVRDNGTGIPHALLDRIFNPFFTTKPAGAGTGLGLSLSYDIITQKHKGTINVDTQEGEFTEFILTLPRLPLTDAGANA